MSARHFLSLLDFTTDELLGVIRRGIELKDLRKRGVLFEPLKNRVLGMIFEKSSTRTRVSFEAGMIQLGGQAIFLSPRSRRVRNLRLSAKPDNLSSQASNFSP